ncbi:glutathione synthase [Wolbachia endosymbiont of Ctenocephalides felis wCfeJ]|uniref:glutathione synthase n=1 Tax=Wolbachia endosymbiont of Ctenocephalides felis wCfeJ TaxID=2732594 RepID=UPI00144550BE|nr:glutathione synthase [Wolbachia endosymbiont of Ctenocephalides felis wCfeJ]WCR58459.1 MAG: Glutathione synthetase [Wolbachia endosymbiont of Ctenocephalides felis wCfeJ]
MKVAFQMDENINFETDTTFALIKEAQIRKHEVFIYVPNNLALKLNQPIALAQRVSANDSSFTPKKDVTINLNEMDIIFIRQDPPFDVRYITTTYILEKTSALVINNPTEIRNCPEKLITSLFPELTPPTLITENVSMIRDFYHDYRDIILKPLYSYGGNDVIRIQDENSIQVVVELMIAKYECPVIAQAFCKNIDKDKRILLLDGQPIGIMKRVPRDGEIRTNLRLGASFEPAKMNDRDNEICNKIGPELKKRGLIFVGIDIIGDFLLEINTTSPTGVVYINKLYNISLEKELWDEFEKKANSHICQLNF